MGMIGLLRFLDLPLRLNSCIRNRPRSLSRCTLQPPALTQRSGNDLIQQAAEVYPGSFCTLGQQAGCRHSWQCIYLQHIRDAILQQHIHPCIHCTFERPVAG